MRLSKSYWKTYKEVPSDAELISHQLLIRAGLIYKASGGIYSYLPFALKVIHKIENIIREELDKIDCQEIQMSMVTPGRMWKESGRWETMGPEMLRFQDRGERDLCLSPTNEEAVTAIFRDTISSYKQLPMALYQINTKFRDEVRPRFGLLRGREFSMKDAYSFHLDKSCMDIFYEKMYGAYQRIFSRMGLEFTVVEADAGAMAEGDAKTHEFQVLAENGEDSLIIEKKSGYAANIEKAATKRSQREDAPVKDLKEIETPDKGTIQEVCEFLNCPKSHSLKSLVYTGIKGEVETHYLILLLGDDELSESKLKNALGVDHITPSSEEVLEEYGLFKGFIGPVQLKKEIQILMDLEVNPNASYVVGANKPHYHFEGLLPCRDMKNYKTLDLRLSQEGDFGPGGGPVEKLKGIEVGHIFQLGDKYTKSMKASVLGEDGKHKFPLMGCYGIGVTRTLQAAIEQSHDKNGIIWPASIAPAQVYLALIGKKEETKSLGTEIYEEMKKAGFEVVFDDRGLGPGAMFKDADLLGLPIRVLLGERDYEKTEKLEIKLRKTGEVIQVSKGELIQRLQEIRKNLK